MATGPHSSDSADQYLNQVIEYISNLEYADEERNQSTGEASIVGEVDIHRMLEECGGGVKLEDDRPYEALDDVYSVLSTTSNGNQRLEGLNAVKIGWDAPVEGRTWRDWKQKYREQGLIEGVDNPEVTPKGEIFLDKRLNNIDTGEVYRALSTKGNTNTGKKIQSFILQPADMTHSEISEATGMPKRTVSSTFEDLREVGALTEDNELTMIGVETLKLINYQIDELAEIEDADF